MMEKWTRKTSAPVGNGSLRPHIKELNRPDNDRSFGFLIGGLYAGPNLVVTAQAALARQVFQRILLIPGLKRIKGCLYLVSLDSLDDLNTPGSLPGLLGLQAPVDNSLALPAVDLDSLGETSAKALVRRNYFAVLRLCARMGMIQGRGVPPQDPPLQEPEVEHRNDS